MVYTDGNYMIADSSRELQGFINKTNLPQQHLNSASFIPHYQISEKHLITALSAGAKEVSPEKLQEIARKVYLQSS